MSVAPVSCHQGAGDNRVPSAWDLGPQSRLFTFLSDTMWKPSLAQRRCLCLPPQTHKSSARRKEATCYYVKRGPKQPRPHGCAGPGRQGAWGNLGASSAAPFGLQFDSQIFGCPLRAEAVGPHREGHGTEAKTCPGNKEPVFFFFLRKFS